MTPDNSALLAASKACPIVPVLTIHDVKDAGPLAKALAAGGLTIAEITLRTEAGLAAISEMKSACPDMLVGAGTVLSQQDVAATIQAGSDFLVTPAVSSRLLPALKASIVPVLPGTATPSEALELYEEGFEILKFFPAETNGGVGALKSMAAPMPNLKFMPTGGINAGSIASYLALPNVVAAGGSWMVSKDALARKDWDAVTKAAAEAVAAISK